MEGIVLVEGYRMIGRKLNKCGWLEVLLGATGYELKVNVLADECQMIGRKLKMVGVMVEEVGWKVGKRNAGGYFVSWDHIWTHQSIKNLSCGMLKGYVLLKIQDALEGGE